MIGITYYIISLQNQNKARQASILTTIQNRSQTKEFWEIWKEVMYSQDMSDFDTWIEKHGPDAENDSFVNFVSLGAYYEHLGVLVKQGFINPQHIMETGSGPLLMFWNKSEKVTREMRERLNNPLAHIEVENLADYVKSKRKDYDPQWGGQQS